MTCLNPKINIFQTLMLKLSIRFPTKRALRTYVEMVGVSYQGLLFLI